MFITVLSIKKVSRKYQGSIKGSEYLISGLAQALYFHFHNYQKHMV